MKYLVTGAKGAVGRKLCERLWHEGEVIETDIDTLDVTLRFQCEDWIYKHEPDVIFHLAGHKLATEGEMNPEKFATTNVTGTANIVKTARALGHGKVVFVSTCKAADPETAYGASKLIAERIALNAGAVVARFFNVPEAGPSVFTLWKSLPEDEPIPYTNCQRYFVSLEKSLDFLLRASRLPWGRYAPDPGPSLHMRLIAKGLYPDRELVEIPRRRGDRAVEPLHAACEQSESYGEDLRIVGAHDPEMARLKVAA